MYLSKLEQYQGILMLAIAKSLYLHKDTANIVAIDMNCSITSLCILYVKRLVEMINRRMH